MKSIKKHSVKSCALNNHKIGSLTEERRPLTNVLAFSMFEDANTVSDDVYLHKKSVCHCGCP